MKDAYPPLPTIPSGALVDREHQPDYLDGPPGFADCDVASGILRATADDARRGDRPAIVWYGHDVTLTFAELDQQVLRLAHALVSLGIRPGDRVAFRSDNRPEGIIAALSIWRAGGVVVPTPVQARAPELEYLLKDTGARILITQGGESLLPVAAVLNDALVDHVITFDAADDAPTTHLWDELLASSGPDFDGGDVDPDSVAIIWHTGGTTGLPKGCYHTHRRFLKAGYSLHAATGIEPGERWAAAAPIGHALGFIHHTIYTLLAGATIVLVDRFQRPDVLLRAIDEHEVDTFTAIAATWARMKDALEADSSLPTPTRLRRAFAMWQSASSSAVYDWWNARGVQLQNNFGSTSFATWVLVPRGGEIVAPGALGRPAPGYDVVAIDPDADGIVPVPTGAAGRMAVRGPTGLTYWNRPELQQRDVRAGWTLVDDMIELDDAGNARYLGRTDFLISTAGYKVSPVEVESVLAAHPAVREVAVLGLPDVERHEIVAAFVAVGDGVVASVELRCELQDLVKRELAPYKYPRRVEFIDALPRDAVGKVQQRLLIEGLARPDADGQ